MSGVCRSILLSGPHPYVGATVATLPVKVERCLPGVGATTQAERRVLERASGGEATVWQPLAGPYRTVPGRCYGHEWHVSTEQAELDSAALLSLLWDLTGQPIRPGGARRRGAHIAVVEGADGINVYRDARECMTCELAREAARDSARHSNRGEVA